MSPVQNNQQMMNLRSRYVWTSAIITIVLLSAASIATWYAQHVTHQNTSVLQLRDMIYQKTNELRNAIWSADIALNASLISPEEQYNQQVNVNLKRAEEILNSFANELSTSKIGFQGDILKLKKSFFKLSDDITALQKNREDPNWVYPALPYISNKLLIPNREFELAAELALAEIAESDGRSYASELYGLFDQVRDLWRRKILNFRAVVIRFSGLNEPNKIPQEENIDNIHLTIETKLDQLEKLRDQDKLGFQSEESLIRMRAASKQWYVNWQKVRVYRNTTVWRADLQFMETTLRPSQQNFFSAINDLENSIMAWSEHNINTVQLAATQISLVLWGLSFLAIIFVVLLYKLLDRSVLSPISKIASSISAEGDIHLNDLSPYSSIEIDKLISAFNNLQRQIHQRQVALEHQALHDSLTGLPNRVLLKDRLSQAIRIMHRNNDSMALLLLDLNRFKEINDALGHQAGDELLQLTSKRLEKLLRESDTVARLGGDEFAIVAPTTKSDDAELFAQKIVESINEVYCLNGQNIYVGVSVGIAIYPENGLDADTLTRHADIAMYHAKRNSLGYYIYQKQTDSSTVDRLALVGDLHDELNNPQHLNIHYQPQVSLLTQEVVTIEALLRWHHPQLGNISPEQIISMAEHTGLIGTLTNWIIETAIRESTEANLLNNKCEIAINLSAWNLQDPELPGTIRRVLDLYELPARQLVLEITESAMMNDPVRARQILNVLSDMGIQLAIDDFGTGFSSLGYIKLLPVDSLKIDKSFVIDMLEDENDAIIVQSTIDLAHNLGLTVIAEGVENNESMTRLRKLKCDIAQGYYISKPVPVAELLQWMNGGRLQLANR